MALTKLFFDAGQEPDRSVLVRRGILALVVLGMVVTVLTMAGRGAFADETRAVVVLDTAGGSLIEGADVKYGGVIVGRVRELRHVANGSHGVEVEVALPGEHAQSLPGNVTARVLPASVFGTSFVDLVAVGAPLGELRAGQRIEQDRGRETLELQHILDNLDRVIVALGPAELAGALDGLAGALDGNGERLGDLLENVADYLARLNPEMGLVRENLALLASNLESFERYAPDLFTATEDLLVAARTISSQEEQFAALARQGTDTVRGTNQLLVENRDALAEALVQTAVVVNVLFSDRERLTSGLLGTFDLAARFGSAMAEGPYLRIDGELVREQGPAYGPHDCPAFDGRRGRGC